MPALSKAKAMAQSASCSSNLKQFGIALAGYQGDYNDYNCYAIYSGNGSAAAWYTMLAPYCGIKLGGSNNNPDDGKQTPETIRTVKTWLCPSRIFPKPNITGMVFFLLCQQCNKKRRVWQFIR